MYFLLILFFGSLLGIIFMIGKKLFLLKNEQESQKKEIIFKTSYLEEWKHLIVQNIKKHGYLGLVATIRFYVQSTNLLKNKYYSTEIIIESTIIMNGVISSKMQFRNLNR